MWQWLDGLDGSFVCLSFSLTLSLFYRGLTNQRIPPWNCTAPCIHLYATEQYTMSRCSFLVLENLPISYFIQNVTLSDFTYSCPFFCWNTDTLFTVFAPSMARLNAYRHC